MSTRHFGYQVHRSTTPCNCGSPVVEIRNLLKNWSSVEKVLEGLWVIIRNYGSLVGRVEFQTWRRFGWGQKAVRRVGCAGLAMVMSDSR